MVRLRPCSCGLQYLVRVKPAAWMCFVPTRRHYLCAKCKERQLLPKSSFAAWWRPSESEDGAAHSLPLLDAGPRGTRMRAHR